MNSALIFWFFFIKEKEQIETVVAANGLVQKHTILGMGLISQLKSLTRVQEPTPDVNLS